MQEPVAEELNKLVTIQDLQNAWKRFSTEIEKENVRLFTILNNHLPQIEKDHTIHLELSSPVQEVEIEKNRDSIMLFLKKELHNSLLNLKVKVAEHQANSQEKVFTAADKFKVMMEKNPALAMLKQQFNLDLE